MQLSVIANTSWQCSITSGFVMITHDYSWFIVVGVSLEAEILPFGSWEGSDGPIPSMQCVRPRIRDSLYLEAAIQDAH